MDACMEIRIFCWKSCPIRLKILRKIYDFYISIYTVLQLPAGPINIHAVETCTTPGVAVCSYDFYMISVL